MDWRLEFYWQGGDWGDWDGEEVDIGGSLGVHLAVENEAEGDPLVRLPLGRRRPLRREARGL